MIKRVQVGDKVYDISILDDIYVDLHMAGKKDGKVIRSDRYKITLEGHIDITLELPIPEGKIVNNPELLRGKRG